MLQLFAKSILLFALSISIKAIGQDDPQPTYDLIHSPDPASQFRVSTGPVDLYTGTASINVPLEVVRSKRLSLPISLTYNARGNKVQDIASWVGLGWDLNAGGKITRVVRGLPDESANGFRGANGIGQKAFETPNFEYIDKVSRGVWDGAPDIYYLNLPGFSGKMYVDNNWNVFTSPYTALKVRPNGNGWTVTDVNGIVYFFGTETTHRESSVVNNGPSTVTTWNLSRIMAPDGVDVINFHYSTGSQVQYKYYRQKAIATLYSYNSFNAQDAGCTNGPTLAMTDEDVVVKIAAPRYLSTITTPYFTVSFQTGGNRSDLVNGKKLLSILVKNITGSPLSEYHFENSYFQTDGCTDVDCYRLKLDAVYKKFNGTKILVNRFQYNEIRLPARYSHQIDHWGYFNSITNNYGTKIPALVDNNPKWQNCHWLKSYSGANKAAHVGSSLAGMLSRIYHPTGGYTGYHFENHTYYDANAQTNRDAGGVRLESIIKCTDPANCETEFQIKYQTTSGKSTGILFNEPHYSFRTYWHTVYPFLNNFLRQETLHVKSESLVELFDVNGVHVGYNSARVYSPRGYTDYTFTNFDTNEDVFDGPRKHYIYNYSNALVDQLDLISTRSAPFTPPSSRADERGLVKSKKIYAGTKLLQEEEYDYFMYTPWKTIPSYSGMYMRYGGDRKEYFFGKHYLTSTMVYLNYVRKKVYDQTTPSNDLSTYTSTITTHEFLHDHMLPFETVTYNESYPNIVHKTRYRYAIDFERSLDCDGVYQKCMAYCSTQECRDYCSDSRETCENLIAADSAAYGLKALLWTNQIGKPIETVQILNTGSTDMVVSARLNLFKCIPNSSMVVLKASLKTLAIKNRS